MTGGIAGRQPHRLGPAFPSLPFPGTHVGVQGGGNPSQRLGPGERGRWVRPHRHTLQPRLLPRHQGSVGYPDVHGPRLH